MIRLQYLFGVDSQMFNKFQGLYDVCISPSAAVLLLHFTNGVQATQDQIAKVITKLSGKDVISTDLMLNTLKYKVKHSLSNFPDILNDQSLLHR